MRSILVLLAIASTAGADTAGAGLHLGGSSGHETYTGVDLEYERAVWSRLSFAATAGYAAVTEHDEADAGASGHRFAVVAGLRVDALAPGHLIRPFLRGGGGLAAIRIGAPGAPATLRGVAYEVALGADVRLGTSAWLRGEVGFLGFDFDGSYIDQDTHAALLVGVAI